MYVLHDPICTGPESERHQHGPICPQQPHWCNSGTAPLGRTILDTDPPVPLNLIPKQLGGPSVLLPEPRVLPSLGFRVATLVGLYFV